MNKVRFGIIGVGNIGSAHARNLLEGKVEDGILSAICDLKEEKTDAVKAREGAEDVAVFKDYKAMLASGLIDVVIVAVPHYDHPRMVMDALAAGVHAISEKPAGVYTKQVKEMNAAAEKSDKLFGMMFNQRTNCVYRKMREMIAGGELGTIKRVNWIITDWYRTQNYYDSGEWRATWRGEGGGVIFNQCPHQIDLLQWMLGMVPERIRAFCHFGKWHDIEVDDDVTAYMEFPNGATGVFVTTTADAPGSNRLEITGTLGCMICEGGKTLTFTKLEEDEREFCLHGTGFRKPPQSETVEVETDGKNEQHVGIMKNFANAVLGKEALLAPGTEGINSVEMMNAMMLSAWLDKTITLPVDDELYLNELNKRIATGRVKDTVKETVLDTEGTY